MTAFLTANVGPAVAIGGDVRGEIFGVSAELRFVIPSVAYAREPVPGATSTRPAEFDVSQISALFVPCGRYKYFVGCGVAQLGSVIMQTPVAFETSLFYAFGPRVGFEVPFAERFSAFAFGEVLLTPNPGGIRLTEPVPGKPDVPPNNTQWEQPVASAFFGAGVSVRFR